MFFAEIVVVQGIEADHRDHLVVADDRHGDLALQEIAHGAVEAAGLLLLLDPRDDLGLLGEGHVAGQAALLGRQLLAADQKRRDILLEPLLVLGADDVPGLVLHHQPFDPVPLADYGDAAGIRADQLGGLGKHLGQERLEALGALVQKVGDLGQHPDLQVFAPHLADDPLDHLGMGLQEPHLKIAETVQVVGKVVHQADDAAALGLEAGHHVQ